MEFLNVFASVDTDEDLVISEADLDRYGAAMKYEKAFTRKWLRLFDADRDGKFTFTDFCETLGLDENIYEEKLRDVRSKIATRQQQQQKQQEEEEISAQRASRRVHRLPRQPATADKPAAEEVKENVKPQVTQKVKSQPPPEPPAQEVKKPAEDHEIEEDIVKPQATQKIRAGVPQQDAANKASSPDQVEVELNAKTNSLQVEFADMGPKDLEVVKLLVAKFSSEQSAKDFDRQMMHELDKKLGKTWQCQTNPMLNPKEVNYLEGHMAVMVDESERRVMVWKPQPAGGMCCCS